MSRRSIFLLAAMVVVLYFFVIAFMVSPLHGSRRAYLHGRLAPLARVGPVAWCRELRRRAAGPAVALVSFPGSGNTWLRYLLQQVTGIMTGSMYMDYGLRVHGFPAENVSDGSVLVVKTHEVPPLQSNKFAAAILLIRNPRDAILADFHRLHKGHIGTAPKSAFERKSREPKKSYWSVYVARQLVAWQSLHEQWLSRFAGRLLPVFYEALVRDTRASLREMLGFLNHTVTENDMTCTMLQKEGIYRRRRKLEDFDPFTADMYRALGSVRARVLDLVAQYQRTHNITDKAGPGYALKSSI